MTLGVLRAGDESAPRAPLPSLARLDALVSRTEACRVDRSSVVVHGPGRRVAGDGRRGRVPDRAGVADERAAPRGAGRARDGDADLRRRRIAW